MELTQKEISIICNALYESLRKVTDDIAYYSTADDWIIDCLTEYADEIRDLHMRMCAKLEDKTA